MNFTPTPTPITVTADECWDTPLGSTIFHAWDNGWDGYVFGFSPDGSHALLVHTPNLDDPSKNYTTVASIHSRNGLGRWECTGQHLSGNMALYSDRFPVR